MLSSTGVTKALVALAVVFPLAALAENADPQADVKYKSVSDSSNNKINMVITTLEDILQSVVNEEKEETTMYNKYVQWCSTETTGMAKDLVEMKAELSNAKVFSEEATATIDALTLTIRKNEEETEETKDAVAQAVNLRNDDDEKYNEEMQTNTQSLRQLDQAIDHVNGVQHQGGFLQNGVLQRLTLNQPGESSYVLGVMKGLKDKLVKTRTEVMKTEEEEVSMHNSFMQTKGQSLANLQEATTNKKIENTETHGRKESTQRKISKLTEEIAELEDRSKHTKDVCEKTTEEWKVRQEDRTKEKAALTEAIRFLTESNKEQLFLFQKRTEESNEEDSIFTPTFVQTASDYKYADNAFFAAASAELSGESGEVDRHMEKENFDGIKEVVRKLIISHQDNQKEETEKKKYCEKEIATKDDEKEQTIIDLDAVKANIEKKSAESEQLAKEVDNMYQAIEDIKRGLEDATKIRKQENHLYETSSKDRILAIKVLNQAKAVLNEFYKHGNKKLMQIAGSQPAKWSPGSPRKTTATFGAVSMIQDILDDVKKEQSDATKAEEDAKVEYANLAKESRENTDEKHQDITQRVTAKAKLGVQINTLKETEVQLTNDLGAINHQLASLHEACDELLQFYNRRVKARSFEVAQLRDVMDIVSGSSIAARTGLLAEDA
jgi:hypothetical protein